MEVIEPTQTQHTVAEAVRASLQDRHPGGLTLEVVESGIRKEEYWWSVPVRVSAEPPRLYEYYEALADVEGELDEKQHLKVLLIPMLPQ